MNSKTTYRIIAVVFLTMTFFMSALSARDVDAAEGATSKEALEQVKADLLGELKERGYGDLADTIDIINPEKLGDFLGNAAGGDFDSAFNIAGSSAADYLHGKFVEQLNGRLDEIIQPNSPAADMLKYVPWNPADGKQIAIKLLRGDYAGAGDQLSAMVRTEGTKNLKQLSKDIIAGGIDWVLSPTVGMGAGALFLQLVEYEMAGIEWFKKYTSEYLSEDLQNEYNRLRKSGQNPRNAFHLAEDRIVPTYRYPFNGMNSDEILQYLEAHYAKSIDISQDTFTRKKKAAAQDILQKLSADVERQKEDYERNLKTELIEIFAQAAKDNAELKKFIAGLKKARDNIDAIQDETEQLERFWRRNRKAFDVSRMEERKRDMESQLAETEKALSESNLEDCNQSDQRLEQVDKGLRDIEGRLEKIRDVGRECKKIVKKICDNPNDPSIVEKGVVALKKRFGFVGAQRREMKTLRSKAIADLKAINGLKKEIISLLQKRRAIESRINQIDKWKKLIRAAKENVDGPNETVAKLHAEIRAIFDDPAYDRFRGKEDSIRYKLLRDADEAKEAFEQQKSEVETGLRKTTDSLEGFDSVKEALERFGRSLESAVAECASVQKLDLAAYKRRIQRIDEKDKQYKDGLEKLYREATVCAGEIAGTVSSDSLQQAKILLNKARARGGFVIDRFQVAENVQNDLAASQASAAAALRFLSTSSGNAGNLITACAEARTKNRQSEKRIQAATKASTAYLMELKKNYEVSANAGAKACQAAQVAAKSKDRQTCSRAAQETRAQAIKALNAAEGAMKAAAEMKSLYVQVQSQRNLGTFDELLREIPAVIQSLKDRVRKAESELAVIDAESIGEEIKSAERAARDANKGAQDVAGLVGQIRGLLSGIEPALASDAEQIRNDAAGINEIAQRRSSQADSAAKAARASGEKTLSQTSEARSRISELSAMIQRLVDCRSTGAGGGLNELRANSDMGEVFAPAAKADADGANFCFEMAAKSCNEILTSNPGNQGSDLECRKDSDCEDDYVCGENNRCVSPVADPSYGTFVTTRGSGEQDRDRDRIDSELIDRDLTATGGGDRFNGSGLGEAMEGSQEWVQAQIDEENERDDSSTDRNSGAVRTTRSENSSGSDRKRDKTPDKGSKSESQEDGTKDTKPEIECKANDDCKEGFVCNEKNRCVPKPSDTRGMDVTVIGTASPGKCKIVNGQLVPVENWPVNIDGMTVHLKGPVEKTQISSPSGSFSFPEIPAGEYTISVKEWDYGMTSAALSAPAGKKIKIVLKGSCPYLYVWTGDRYEKENDIYSTARLRPSELIASLGNGRWAGVGVHNVSVQQIPEQFLKEKAYRDYYRIVAPMSANEDGNYRLKIVERAGEHSFTDLVSLLAIERPKGYRVGVTRRGQVFRFKELHAVSSVRHLTGDEDVHDGSIPLYDGDGLEIELPSEAFEGGVLAVTWQGFQDGNPEGHSSSPGRPHLALQRLDCNGNWETQDWVYPRDETDQAFLLLEPKTSGVDADNRVRLMVTSCLPERFHSIKQIAWGKIQKGEPDAVTLPLLSAQKMEPMAEVRKQLVDADGRCLSLAPEETVHLEFSGGLLAPDKHHTFIFVAEGFYVPAPVIRIASTN